MPNKHRRRPPLSTTAEYSPHKRTRITVGYQLGLTPRALFAKENVSPRSVYGIAKRYEYQASGRSLPRSGRPRKLTTRDIRLLLRIIDIDPFVTSEELRISTGLSCSTRTIRRKLVRRGIQHYRARRRPKISEANTVKRLAFARRYVGKPTEW